VRKKTLAGFVVAGVLVPLITVPTAASARPGDRFTNG
jgi:hypothetical protein